MKLLIAPEKNNRDPMTSVTCHYSVSFGNKNNF